MHSQMNLDTLTRSSCQKNCTMVGTPNNPTYWFLRVCRCRHSITSTKHVLCGVHRQRVSPDAGHPGLSRRQRRERKRAAVRRARAEYYEKGTFWGKPAACTMLDLALQLHMDNRHFLWCATLILYLTLHSSTPLLSRVAAPPQTRDFFL